MATYLLAFALIQISNVVCASNTTVEEETPPNPWMIPVIITSSLFAFLLYMAIIYAMFRTIRYTTPFFGPWTLFLLFFFPPSFFFIFFWVYLLGRQVSFRNRVYMYPDPDSRYNIRGPALSQVQPQNVAVNASVTRNQSQTAAAQFQTQPNGQPLSASNVPPSNGFVNPV